MKEVLKDKKLSEILEDSSIVEIACHAISGWDLSKEEFYDWTIEELGEKKGWVNLERGLGRLLKVAKKGNYYFPLYSKEECKEDSAREGRNIVFFPSDDPKADKRPFILMTPGGAFINVWHLTEGWPSAEHFNSCGYHVFLLTYQVGIEGSAVRAMDDMARALELIRKKEDELCVRAKEYITCGFSAGGYIACLWNTLKGYEAYGLPKPQACLLIYPVTSYKIMNQVEWGEIDPKVFVRAALACDLKEACESVFEIPEHVEGFPPTAIFVASQDELVDPNHSKMLAEALKKAGITCRLEVGPSGGHGFGDGSGMCMEGWPERAMWWFESL